MSIMGFIKLNVVPEAGKTEPKGEIYISASDVKQFYRADNSDNTVITVSQGGDHWASFSVSQTPTEISCQIIRATI